MKPTPIESYAIDAMEKRIREVFPHGVTIRYHLDSQEPPMCWHVTAIYDNGAGGWASYGAKGFTLAGALLEAANAIEAAAHR